jgi:hypothetical protein
MTSTLRYGLFTALVLGGVSLAALASREVSAAPDAVQAEGKEGKANEGKTGIAWEVQPAEVVIFVDDKRIGTAGELKFTEAKPGKHTVKLMRNKDETEMEVNVKKGQAIKFVYQFED